jgi:putative membrane protein
MDLLAACGHTPSMGALTMPDLDKPPADDAARSPLSGRDLSPKVIIGIVIAVTSLVFVFSNTERVSFKFLWLEVSASGWVFLFLLLALGFLAGFLIGRNRYRPT